MWGETEGIMLLFWSALFVGGKTTLVGGGKVVRWEGGKVGRWEGS